ncbi:hypothetical protein P7C70_g7869, partial [Phenoliferia sp. Uapishka_3]
MSHISIRSHDSSSLAGITPEDSVPRQRFDVAPGLGTGGRAFHSHLPTIHGVFFARCRFCYYSTSHHLSAADATRQWRNRHAIVHGIKSWDLAQFHPSLPLDVVPAHVPQSEGTGIVYFANRLRARHIFEYSDIIAESRHTARIFARLTQPLRRNDSWHTSMIPADEVALLYRRTRLTPSVTSRRDPDGDSVKVNEFRGVSLSVFNSADLLLDAVGADFDPVSLGSLLWFWIFGVRALRNTLVVASPTEVDVQGWEEYRKGLYATVSLPSPLAPRENGLKFTSCQMWHYTLSVAEYRRETTNNIQLNWSLFRVAALPSLLPSTPLVSPFEAQPNLFLHQLAAKISEAVETNERESVSEVEADAAEEWKTLLEDDGCELRKWNHSGSARDWHEAKTAWPRVIEVWCSLSPAERASWCLRKDPARTARSVARATEARMRTALGAARADAQSTRGSLGRPRRASGVGGPQMRSGNGSQGESSWGVTTARGTEQAYFTYFRQIPRSEQQLGLSGNDGNAARFRPVLALASSPSFLDVGMTQAPVVMSPLIKDTRLQQQTAPSPVPHTSLPTCPYVPIHVAEAFARIKEQARIVNINRQRKAARVAAGKSEATDSDSDSPLSPLPPLIPPSLAPHPPLPCNLLASASNASFITVTSFTKTNVANQVNSGELSPDVIRSSLGGPTALPTSDPCSEAQLMTDTEVEDEIESCVPAGRRLKRKMVSSDPIEASVGVEVRRGFGNLKHAPLGTVVPPSPAFNRSQPFGPPKHYHHRPVVRAPPTGAWVQIVPPRHYEALVRSTALDTGVRRVWVDFDASGALPQQWLTDPIGSFHAQEAQKAANAERLAGLSLRPPAQLAPSLEHQDFHPLPMLITHSRNRVEIVSSPPPSSPAVLRLGRTSSSRKHADITVERGTATAYVPVIHLDSDDEDLPTVEELFAQAATQHPRKRVHAEASAHASAENKREKIMAVTPSFSQLSSSPRDEKPTAPITSQTNQKPPAPRAAILKATPPNKGSARVAPASVPSTPLEFVGARAGLVESHSPTEPTAPDRNSPRKWVEPTWRNLPAARPYTNLANQLLAHPQSARTPSRAPFGDTVEATLDHIPAGRQDAPEVSSASTTPIERYDGARNALVRWESAIFAE